MNIIWNIVKKDLRRLRWPLLALAILWTVKACFLLEYYNRVYSGPTAFNSEKPTFDMAVSLVNKNLGVPSAFLYLGSFLDFCLLIYVIINLLRADSALDERAFWRTRPVSRAQMLAAKALSLVLVVWLVPLVLQTTVDLYKFPLSHDGRILVTEGWLEAHTNLRFPGGQWGGYIQIGWYVGIIQMMLIQGIWAMIGVLVASLWRKPILGFGTLAALGLLFVTLFGTGAISDEAYLDVLPIFETCWLVGVGLIFCVMYLRGSQKLGFTLFGVGTAFIFLHFFI